MSTTTRPKYKPRRNLNAHEIEVAWQAWEKRAKKRGFYRDLSHKFSGEISIKDVQIIFEQISARQHQQIIDSAKRAANLILPADSPHHGRPTFPPDAMFAALALRLFLDVQGSCTFAASCARLRCNFPERIAIFGPLRRLPHRDTHRNFQNSMPPETLKSWLEALKTIHPGLAEILEFRLTEEKTLN